MRMAGTPRGAMPPSRAVVLIALVRVHARDGRATLRSVAAEADLSPSTTYAHLTRLVDDGLVGGFRDGSMGALRPLVEAVPIGGTR